MSKLALILTFLLLAGAMAADTVMVATTVNYPDAIVAASASVRDDIPIVFTDKDSLPDGFLEKLTETGVTKVILLGGKAVISQNVEDSISAGGFEVVRLWGETRFETAVEISKYFWPNGASEIVVVYDRAGRAEDEDNSAELLRARVIAAKKKVPLILLPADTIPQGVQGELNRLNYGKAYAFGTRLRDEVKNRLNGVEDVDEGNAFVDNELAVIVAVSDFQGAVEASVERNENTAVFLVRSQTEIDEVVANVLNFEKVKVVGKPDLARKIEDALTEAGITFEERGQGLKQAFQRIKARIQTRLQSRECQSSGGRCAEFNEGCLGAEFEVDSYTCPMQNQKCCMPKETGTCPVEGECLSFDPVCADSVTFDNSCDACEAGAASFTRGECQSCLKVKTCGSDGKLYPTNCLPSGVEKVARHRCACQQTPRAYCSPKLNMCRTGFVRANLICSDEMNEICCAPEV